MNSIYGPTYTIFGLAERHTGRPGRRVENAGRRQVAECETDLGAEMLTRQGNGISASSSPRSGPRVMPLCAHASVARAGVRLTLGSSSAHPPWDTRRTSSAETLALHRAHRGAVEA